MERTSKALTRRLSVMLDEDEYHRLICHAARDTRSPEQQATHLIKQAIRPVAAAESPSNVGEVSDGCHAA